MIDATDHFSAGDNHLMSVGTSKSDAIATVEEDLHLHQQFQQVTLPTKT